MAASLITPNKWYLEPLETVRLTWTADNPTNRHRLTYRFHGEAMTTYDTLPPSTKMEDFTFPEEWVAAKTDSTVGTLVIRLATYENTGAYIGDKTIEITIYIPPSYGPTIGSFTATLVKNGGPADINKYIKSVSKVTLSMTATAQAGATIIKRQIIGGGYSQLSSPATFGPLNTAGVITFTAIVTDSRGFSKTTTLQITVQAYASPSLSGVSMFRCNSNGVANKAGTYVSLKGTGVISSIDGQNTPLLQGRVYMRGGTPGAFTTMTNNTVKILGGGLLLTTKTYIAEIKISDKIGDYSMTVIIPTDSGVGLHIIDGAKGAAIGKYAETQGVFESAWPIISPYMRGNENLLHNWDFRNPVNQRGVTSPPTIGAYFLDRWGADSTGTVWNSSGYVYIPPGYSMRQRMEGVGLAGKVLTYSWLLTSGVIETYTFTMPSNTSEVIGGGLVASTNYSTGVTLVDNYFLSVGGNNIVAVKLELGTVSTLAYDAPMDYATERLKCLRYFEHKPCFSVQVWAVDPTNKLSTMFDFYPKRIFPTFKFYDMTGVPDKISYIGAISTSYAVRNVVSSPTDYARFIKFENSVDFQIGYWLQGAVDIAADL